MIIHIAEKGDRLILLKLAMVSGGSDVSRISRISVRKNRWIRIICSGGISNSWENFA